MGWSEADIRRFDEVADGDVMPVVGRETAEFQAPFVGDGPCMAKVIGQIRAFSCYDAPVLIQGETGTGKELAARALHYFSMRRGGPFVPINCATLPDTLIANELFGHEPGAFTGADGQRTGLIDQACHGTLFFDEVDALSPMAQAAVLRFLEDQEFRPLGGGTSRQGDVRIVAATNAALLDTVEAKEFRDDLFYRLNVLNLHMPPLRAHREDIPALASHFLTRLAKRYGGAAKALGPCALDALMTYDWPGNVRELENRLHHAYVVASGQTIEQRDLKLERDERPASRSAEAWPRTDGSFAEAKARVVADFERTYLHKLLARTRGNVSAASRLARKDRRAFNRLLTKHHIDRQQYLPDN